jgi:mannose-6-phosphate isomerase class I
VEKIIEIVKEGIPIYLKPYAEPKVWGVGGIGEYWYGAESGDKSSIAVIDGAGVPMAKIVESIPEEVLGKDVVASFGKSLPLVKILTPKGRLSVQFHDAKNELWVVTGIDEAMISGTPKIIIGFNEKMIQEYGDQVKDKYKVSLETYGHALNVLIAELEQNGQVSVLNETCDVIAAAKKLKEGNVIVSGLLKTLLEAEKALDEFYNYVEVQIGDVIPVPQGTLHALGAGIEVVEPQIAGPTQSLEDGSTYPVRYYFPGYPAEGAGKQLDLDRINETNTTVWETEEPVMVASSDGAKIERLPGGFEDKGMEVDRITMNVDAELEYNTVKSYHILTVIHGSASVVIGGKKHDIPRAVPGGEMLLIPASVGDFKIQVRENTLIIDTFTPIS